MRVKSADIVNPDVVLKLFSSLSSLLKKVGAEPNLLEVSLMWVFG
jgi:hypothetical protein